MALRGYSVVSILDVAVIRAYGPFSVDGVTPLTTDGGDSAGAAGSGGSGSVSDGGGEAGMSASSGDAAGAG